MRSHREKVVSRAMRSCLCHYPWVAPSSVRGQRSTSPNRTIVRVLGCFVCHLQPRAGLPRPSCSPRRVVGSFSSSSASREDPSVEPSRGAAGLDAMTAAARIADPTAIVWRSEPSLPSSQQGIKILVTPLGHPLHAGSVAVGH